MGRLVHDLDTSDELAFDRTAARIARCDQSSVSAACKSTVYALSRYLRLLEEESRQPFDYEVAAAKAQFDAALATLRSEPCRSRSDHRAKHLALDLLASAFPYDDCRISELNRSVVEDMIRLFEVEVSRALAPGALAYSGRVDSSAAE